MSKRELYSPSLDEDQQGTPKKISKWVQFNQREFLNPIKAGNLQLAKLEILGGW